MSTNIEQTGQPESGRAEGNGWRVFFIGLGVGAIGGIGAIIDSGNPTYTGGYVFPIIAGVSDEITLLVGEIIALVDSVTAQADAARVTKTWNSYARGK